MDLKRIRAIAATTLLASTLAAPVSAAFITFDLTGNWTGSIKCKSSLGGAKHTVTLTPAMQVQQSGLNIGVQLTSGVTTTSYAGLANPAAKKPEQKGEFALVRCGTNDVLGDLVQDELGRMAASTKPPKVKATFKGVSFFSNPGTFPAEAGSCKWKWKRTDTGPVDGGIVTECGPAMLRLPLTTQP